MKESNFINIVNKSKISKEEKIKELFKLNLPEDIIHEISEFIPQEYKTFKTYKLQPRTPVIEFHNYLNDKIRNRYLRKSLIHLLHILCMIFYIPTILLVILILCLILVYMIILFVITCSINYSSYHYYGRSYNSFSDLIYPDRNSARFMDKISPSKNSLNNLDCLNDLIVELYDFYHIVDFRYNRPLYLDIFEYIFLFSSRILSKERFLSRVVRIIKSEYSEINQ